MQVHFTPPPLVRSPLGRLDARWRLATLALAVVAVALVRHLLPAALALAGALLLAVLARLPWRWYAARLAVAGALLALFVVPLPLLAHVGWLDGLRLAAVILLDSLALFTLACVLLVTAPLETTLKAAHSLRIPGLLIHLALLAYRYLFVLRDELARLRLALRVRGFRNRASWHAWKTAGTAAGTLLVRGHDRAERVAHAMRCRGFDGRFRALTEFRTTSSDVLVFVVVLLLGGGLVALDAWLSRM